MKLHITSYTKENLWFERVGKGAIPYQVVIDVRLVNISLVPAEQVETGHAKNALTRAALESEGCDTTLHNEQDLSRLIAHLQNSLPQGIFHLPESHPPQKGNMVLFRARHIDGSPSLAYATACIRLSADGGDIIGDPTDQGKVWGIITAIWSKTDPVSRLSKADA